MGVDEVEHGEDGVSSTPALEEGEVETLKVAEAVELVVQTELVDGAACGGCGPRRGSLPP